MRGMAMGLVLFVAGCGSSYQYLNNLPEPGNAVVRGLPAADYAVPARLPRGDVQLVSFGVTTLQPRAGGPATPALQLRFVVSNSGDAVPWLFDTRRVLVDLGPAGHSRAALANTEEGPPPFVAIPIGERRTIDLYYPLPPGEASAGGPRAFAVTWQVETGFGVTTRRTELGREKVDPGVYAYAPRDLPASAYAFTYEWEPDDYWQGLGFAVGMGAEWWYDPFYPSDAFPGHVAISWSRGGDERPLVGLAGRAPAARSRRVASRGVAP